MRGDEWKRSDYRLEFDAEEDGDELNCNQHFLPHLLPVLLRIPCAEP